MLVDKVVLGKTGLKVSRLSFGTTPLGGRSWRREPAIPPEEGGIILEQALRLGINYWDTAEGYGTHAHVREGLRRVRREEVVISTKTNACTEEEAWKCITRSLNELGTDYIDIYFMHYVNRPEELKRRQGALRAMLEAKESRLIKHIGLSTHRAEVVEVAASMPEIEVLMAKVNKLGYRTESPPERMLEALEKAYEQGKGICIMKVLAYGMLSVEEAFRWAFRIPFVHTVCVGMRTMRELEENVRIYLKVKSTQTDKA